MNDESMRFGLMRHGIAENGSAGQPDSKRRLTAEGRRRLVQQAEWIRTEAVEFDVVVSSPLVRAMQTAEIVADGLNLKTSVDALLTSGCSPDDVIELLSRFGGGGTPLLVGHQPDLSTAVAALTGKHISFGPGDLAIIERASGRHELLRHVPADQQWK